MWGRSLLVISLGLVLIPVALAYDACGIEYTPPWFAVSALAPGGSGIGTGYLFLVDSHGNVFLGAFGVSFLSSMVSFLDDAIMVFSRALGDFVFALNQYNLLMKGTVYPQASSIPTSNALVFYGPSGPLAAITSQGDLYAKGLIAYNGGDANCSGKICPDGNIAFCNMSRGWGYCACKVYYYGGPINCEIWCNSLCGEDNTSGCIPGKTSDGNYYDCSYMVWPFMSAYTSSSVDSDGDGLDEVGTAGGVTFYFPYYATLEDMGWHIEGHVVNCSTGRVFSSTGYYYFDSTYGVAFKDSYDLCIKGIMEYNVWVGRTTTMAICASDHGYRKEVDRCSVVFYVDGTGVGGYGSVVCDWYTGDPVCSRWFTLSPGYHTIRIEIEANQTDYPAIADSWIAYIKQINVYIAEERLVYGYSGSSGCSMYELYETRPAQ